MYMVLVTEDNPSFILARPKKLSLKKEMVITLYGDLPVVFFADR